MDLAEHTNQPTMIPIGGTLYGFSELPIESLGRLQQWLKDHVPHPLDVIRPKLAGFGAEEKAILLEGARKEAAHWPPQLGTAEGAQALLSGQDGQAEVFYEALRVHQPETTRDGARRLYRRLDNERARNPDGPVVRTFLRIVAISFGRGDLRDDVPGGGGLPKAPPSEASPSPGTSSFDGSPSGAGSTHARLAD